MAAGAAAAAGLASNKWTPIVLGVLIVGVAAVGYFGVVRPIMCRTGVITCRSSKRTDKLKAKLKSSDALNPNFYKPTHITFASHEVAKAKADEIEDALDFMDDEEKVYSILGSAKNRHNMSLIAHYYELRHGESLADTLSYDMDSEAELKRMFQIVNGY